ncbi:hypothetical protein V5P93_000346 [Actinokineospora auranticolor]|uniref:Uncharacterized protein n=1 Tax=Actinokineospora auranticolor TaxID=155976 RepID=A0A2S6GKK5_9PSEU|nr:hypothetical protein [Actinokineospora auranticolor]PPK65767.1 hypothetical protein CLV40_11226 [Actinokineospora auranticolor]
MTTQPPDLDPHRLQVAIHELGHYIAWRDLPGAGIRAVRVTGHGRHTEGITTVDWPTDDNGALDHGYLVGLLAGREADLFHKPHSTIPYDPRGCAFDLGLFRRVRRRHQPSRQWSEHDLRASARALIRAHWAEIQRLAPRLARRGRL